MKTTNHETGTNGSKLIPFTCNGIELYQILGIDQEYNPETEPWVYVDPGSHELVLTPLDVSILNLEADLKAETLLTLLEQQEILNSNSTGDVTIEDSKKAPTINTSTKEPPSLIWLKKQQPEFNFFAPAKWPEYAVKFWNAFGFKDGAILHQYGVYFFDHYYRNNKNTGSPFTIRSKEDSPIFAFKVKKDEGKYSFYIYRPFETKWKHSWWGGRPRNHIWGYEQLPEHPKHIIITGGPKDVMVWKLLGINAVAGNSESAGVPSEMYYTLLKKVKHRDQLLVAMDNDDTGNKMAEKISKECSITNLNKKGYLPSDFTLRNGKKAKDISDVVKYFVENNDMPGLEEYKEGLRDMIYNLMPVVFPAFDCAPTEPVKTEVKKEDDNEEYVGEIEELPLIDDTEEIKRFRQQHPGEIIDVSILNEPLPPGVDIITYELTPGASTQKENADTATEGAGIEVIIPSEIEQIPKNPSNDSGPEDSVEIIVDKDAVPEPAEKKRIRTANERLKDAELEPPPTPLIGNFFLRGDITIIFGDTGVGKTLFGFDLSDGLSYGYDTVLGLASMGEPLTVLYYDAELSDAMFRQRYNGYTFSDNLKIIVINEIISYEAFSVKTILTDIKETGANVVIVDNITKLSQASNTAIDIARNIMENLRKLRAEAEVSILVFAHTTKVKPYSPITINQLGGSKYLSNFADCVVGLGRSAKGKNIRYLKLIKSRNAAEYNHVYAFEIVQENNFIKFKPLGKDTEANLLKSGASDIVTNNGGDGGSSSEDEKSAKMAQARKLQSEGKSIRQIADILGVSKSTVSNWLNLLE